MNHGRGAFAFILLTLSLVASPFGFVEKETCNITTGRPSLSGRTTKTVLIDQPIIAWDEVKSLTFDGTRNTLKDDYAVVIYVSEIHFADGTIWEGSI